MPFAATSPSVPFPSHARAPQVTLLLHSLDLEDHAPAFAAAKINGRKLSQMLKQCDTRERLKENWGIDMVGGPFATLRDALEEYAPSGVPTALLDEARERVQQQQPAPAPAPTPAPAPSPAPSAAPSPAPAPVRDEAFARLKAQAPQKVALDPQPGIGIFRPSHS